MTKIRKTITIHPDGLRVIMKEVLNDDMSLISKEIRQLRLSNRDGPSDDDSGYNSKVSYYSDEENSHPRSYVSVHSDADSTDTNATPTEEDVIRMISDLSAMVIEMEKEKMKAENNMAEVSEDDHPVQDRRVIVRGADESTQATQSVTTVATSRGGASMGVAKTVTDDDILKMMQDVSLQATEEIRKSQRQLDVEPLSDEEQSITSADNNEEMPKEPTEEPKVNSSISRDIEVGDGKRELPTTSASADQEPKKLEAIEDSKQEVPKAQIPTEMNSGDSKAATEVAPMNLSVFQEVNNALKNADKENAEQGRVMPSETPHAESQEDTKPVALDKSDHGSQDERSRSYSSRSRSYSPRSRSYSSRSRSYSSRSRSYSSRSRSYSSRSRSYTPESRRSKDEHENKVAAPVVADREKVPEESALGDSKPDEIGEKPLPGGAAPAAQEAPTRQPAPSTEAAVTVKPEGEKVEQVASPEMTAAERSKAIASILNDKTLTGPEKHEKIRALRPPQRKIARNVQISGTKQEGSEADARRRAIQAVHTNTSLTPQEKHKQIQDLLNGGPIPTARPPTTDDAPVSKPVDGDDDAPRPTLVEINQMPSATSVITGDGSAIEDNKPVFKATSSGRTTSLLQTPELPEEANASRDILKSSKQPSFRLTQKAVKGPHPKLVEVGNHVSTQSAITLSSLEEKVSKVAEENSAAETQKTEDQPNPDATINAVPNDAPSSSELKQEKIKPVSDPRKKQQIRSVRSIDSEEAEQVYAMPSDDFEKRESMKIIPTNQVLMGFDPPSPAGRNRASAEEEKQSESDLEEEKKRSKNRSGSIERRESMGSRSYYSDERSYRTGDSRSYGSRSGSRSYYSDRSRSYSRSRSPYSDDGSYSRSRSHTPDSRSRSPYSDENSGSVRSKSVSPPAGDQERSVKSPSPPADDQNRSVQSKSPSPVPPAKGQSGNMRSKPPAAVEDQNPPSAAPPVDDQEPKSPTPAPLVDDQKQKSPPLAPFVGDQKRSVQSKSPHSDGQSGSDRSMSQSRSYTPNSKSRSRSYTPDSKSRSRSYTPDSKSPSPRSDGQSGSDRSMSQSRSYTPDSKSRSRSYTPDSKSRSRSYTPDSRSRSSHSKSPSPRSDGQSGSARSMSQSRSYTPDSKSRSYTPDSRSRSGSYTPDSRSRSSHSNRSYSSRSHSSRSYSSRSKSHDSRSYSSRSKSYDSRSYSSRSQSYDSPEPVVEGNEEVEPVPVTAAVVAEPVGVPTKKKGFKGFFKKFGKKK